jgi:hypothetical protein
MSNMLTKTGATTPERAGKEKEKEEKAEKTAECPIPNKSRS